MFYGWRVVGGAFVAQLFVVGFFTYAVSLLVEPVREEFGVTLEQVMYSLTASTLFGLFLQPVGGILVDRYSVRWVMTAGALLYAAGLFALAKTTTITQYILVFALTMALANALGGIPKVLAAAFDRDGRWLLPDEELGVRIEDDVLKGVDVRLPAVNRLHRTDGFQQASGQCSG